jgi:predicted nuclease of predicted toxin-antitoxin system
MRFLLDECVDLRVGAFLQSLGHDVTSIVQDYQRSLADTDVLTIAAREERTVITNDRDFGELVFLHQHAHTGVIYLRLGTYELGPILARLTDVLNHHADQLDQFLVVDPRRIRVRRTRS